MTSLLSSWCIASIRSSASCSVISPSSIALIRTSEMISIPSAVSGDSNRMASASSRLEVSTVAIDSPLCLAAFFLAQMVWLRSPRLISPSGCSSNFAFCCLAVGFLFSPCSYLESARDWWELAIVTASVVITHCRTVLQTSIGSSFHKL